ncbi:LytR/AlgR family response regulator transcription factor [Eudoraea chungangensis]|uniref:LytR/AlgR family response regulator transcription factor n=1 Tax=Eudoraea chungangensis TaxID=1481905 RepID=UPI0023EB8378|nr:LytTR family DNA-binding domain-containing protein [Eudoraea chungangensis]
MEYSYTIIDSEATSKLQLQHYLEDYGEFICLGEARASDEGLNQILKHSPDIVFINLNEQATNYFGMVKELYQYINTIPLIIGVSKGKKYAYDAIKNNFFDYWLTPYNEFDIRKTILKLKKLFPKEEVSKTICLKSYKDFQYLDAKEVLYLQADNNATDFIMKDGSRISAFKTLKHFENQLPDNFIRVHQSYILNTDFVSRINYGKSICALKESKIQLPFSKSYRENVDGLKQILSKNAISPLN